jgi:putative tryptophan/tyrosine transport system substrate-binding protein
LLAGRSVEDDPLPTFDQVQGCKRQFITLIGGAAAALPLAARAQQPAVPVIGLLDTGTADGRLPEHKALRDAGDVEGRNPTLEYRFAENYPKFLRALGAPPRRKSRR